MGVSNPSFGADKDIKGFKQLQKRQKAQKGAQGREGIIQEEGMRRAGVRRGLKKQ